MAALCGEPAEWAEQQFGACQRGDRRRNKRLIQVAQQFAAQPAAGTPVQAETWADLKAVSRLFDTDDLTPEALLLPHRQLAHASCCAGDIKLIISDTTEIDDTSRKTTRGLGQIGNGSGRGWLAHTALMVNPQTRAADGIVAQEFLIRPVKGSQKKLSSNSIRRSETRESAVWGRVMEQVGQPAEGVTYVPVCDRGADDIEVFHRARHNGCELVIRAERLNRQVIAADGQTRALSAVLAALPPRGERDIEVPAQGRLPARTARVTLRFATVQRPLPKVLTPWLKAHQPTEPLTLQVVELVELAPPKGVTPLRWVL